MKGAEAARPLPDRQGSVRGVDRHAARALGLGLQWATFGVPVEQLVQQTTQGAFLEIFQHRESSRDRYSLGYIK